MSIPGLLRSVTSLQPDTSTLVQEGLLRRLSRYALSSCCPSRMCEVAHTNAKVIRDKLIQPVDQGTGDRAWHQQNGLFVCYVEKVPSSDRSETSLFGNGATKVT